MKLKVKKDGRFITYLRLQYVVNNVGATDWCVHVYKDSKFKELEGVTESRARSWLISHGYSYTIIYR